MEPKVSFQRILLTLNLFYPDPDIARSKFDSNFISPFQPIDRTVNEILNATRAFSIDFCFRSILLDSDELTDSMNNKFVMAAAQKWLRDLLLMLDLGK